MTKTCYVLGSMPAYLHPITIFGPTASGKTALAIALARALDGVVINADSLQVYEHLPTLTARPSAEEEAQAPHRLYGFLPAQEKMDVARWLGLAKAAMAEAQAYGKVPIFCGGTGFYLKALSEGLSPMPQVSVTAAEARLAEVGLEAFESEVFAADPALQGAFEAGDAQRLIRAWSIYQETGRALSDWQREPKQGGIGPVRAFALTPDRAALYGRIDQRFAAMMAGGVVGEVSASPLVEDPNLPIAQAIGAREILALLAGEISEAEVIAAASQQTRNYAKRQMTWVRNQALAAIKLPYKAINEQEIGDLAEIILAYLSQNP